MCENMVTEKHDFELEEEFGFFENSELPIEKKTLRIDETFENTVGTWLCNTI